MQLRDTISSRKSVKFQYNRFSKLWHGELIFKAAVVILIVIINIILSIYTSIKLNPSRHDDNLTLFVWLFLLLYCGFIIDIESSRSLKICISILTLINFVCIERNILSVGITIDFLNLAVLWSIFKCEEINIVSEESYEDEYILPLIDTSKKLLNVYYELWRRNSYVVNRSYSGLLVTRCVIMSCMYLCILLFNTIDKYTYFDKSKFTEMQSVLYLKGKNILKRESIERIFKISGLNGLVILQIVIITLTVLLKPLLLKLINLISVLKNACISLVTNNELGTEEVKLIAEFNSSEFNSQKNLDTESGKQSFFINRVKLINSFIFFFSTFLFGMITYENQEFDITSRMFLLEQNKTVLLCILLPLFGLLIEISMFKDWCWYFIFSWIIFYINIWSDDSIVKNITTMLSGLLFNLSVILFICYQKSDSSQLKKTQEFALSSYIFHKICFFLGYCLSKKILYIHGNSIIKNIFLITTNILIISNLYFLLYVGSGKKTVQSQDENEIEWDVVY